MQDIKNILWAYDFNKASHAAMTYAKELAKLFNAKLIAVNIVQTHPVLHYELPMDILDYVNELVKKKYKEVETKFQKLSKMIKEERIDFKYIIREGNANEEIIKIANEEQADLIIMGNNSEEEGNSTFIGSTVLKVIKSTHIPTMVIKKGARQLKIKRILIPTDLAKGYEKVFDLALEIADKFNAEIYFLHIIEIYSYEGIEKVHDRLMVEVSKIVQENTNALKKKAGKINIFEFARKSINATTGILEFSKEKKIDLIIMGTHARTGVSKYLLGSVTEKIIRLSDLPVIAVFPYEKR